jgi:peptide chain release factor 2
MDAQQGAPDFWNNNERAQKHIVKLNALKKAVLPVVAFQKKVDDVGVSGGARRVGHGGRAGSV